MDAKKSVLVVDDEPAIVNILRIKLRLAGYGVIAAARGAEAIGMVRMREPDIVLLDNLMPGMSGLEVLDEVRTFSRVPIVFFTAKPESVEAALKKGANDYIAKPFQPDELVAKIAAVLGRVNPEQPAL